MTKRRKVKIVYTLLSEFPHKLTYSTVLIKIPHKNTAIISNRASISIHAMATNAVWHTRNQCY